VRFGCESVCETLQIVKSRNASPRICTDVPKSSPNKSIRIGALKTYTLEAENHQINLVNPEDSNKQVAKIAKKIVGLIGLVLPKLEDQMETHDWQTVIKDNFTGILVFSASVIGALIGFLSGSFGFRRERRLRREQWHKEYRHEYLTAKIEAYLTESARTHGTFLLGSHG